VIGRDLLNGFKEIKSVWFEEICIDNRAEILEEIQALNDELPKSCPTAITESISTNYYEDMDDLTITTTATAEPKNDIMEIVRIQEKRI
jgi:hypothetical protein